MTDGVPAPRRSWLRYAFVASLALNLFLIGLIGGQVLSGPDEEETRRPRGYSLSPRVVMEALPEDRHEAIRAYWSGMRGTMRGEWRKIGAIREEVLAALRAVPFDAEALRAAQAREVAARAALRDRFNETSADLLASLTDEERAKVADLAMDRLVAQREYWRERRRQRDARGE